MSNINSFIISFKVKIFCLKWTDFFILVGLNCSVEDCEEKAACPPDSELKADGWGCVCVSERCPQTPACHFRSKRILKHAAVGVPGDCCDVYDCVFPSGKVTNAMLNQLSLIMDIHVVLISLRYCTAFRLSLEREWVLPLLQNR